ncbi:hypothetical protein EDC96DRAFT_550014 [Choanephora cucurbitarum]|nr:hypothetical protein EDC96DRAFT_550014 [Choanephora cucurbitarum]
MSLADHTEFQRRLRRVGIVPIIYHVAKRDNGSQGLETVAHLGATREEPQDLQSVLFDDYDVDLSTEPHMEQMELDEQRISSLTDVCVEYTNPKTYLMASSVPDVSTPFDMSICNPKNVFTTVEILSFMFLNTCRETDSSVNDANDFFYFVNHALKELGGESTGFKTDECTYSHNLS